MENTIKGERVKMKEKTVRTGIPGQIDLVNDRLVVYGTKQSLNRLGVGMVTTRGQSLVNVGIRHSCRCSETIELFTRKSNGLQDKASLRPLIMPAIPLEETGALVIETDYTQLFYIEEGFPWYRSEKMRPVIWPHLSEEIWQRTYNELTERQFDEFRSWTCAVEGIQKATTLWNLCAIRDVRVRQEGYNLNFHGLREDGTETDCKISFPLRTMRTYEQGVTFDIDRQNLRDALFPHATASKLTLALDITENHKALVISSSDEEPVRDFLVSTWTQACSNDSYLVSEDIVEARSEAILEHSDAYQEDREV